MATARNRLRMVHCVASGGVFAATRGKSLLLDTPALV